LHKITRKEENARLKREKITEKKSIRKKILKKLQKKIVSGLLFFKYQGIITV